MNKPRISLKRYPKLSQAYWRVSPMPPKGERKMGDFKRWSDAYTFVTYLNGRMGPLK